MRPPASHRPPWGRLPEVLRRSARPIACVEEGKHMQVIDQRRSRIDNLGRSPYCPIKMFNRTAHTS
eukprot:809502-Pyramimonas_sp.AAC.1